MGGWIDVKAVLRIAYSNQKLPVGGYDSRVLKLLKLELLASLDRFIHKENLLITYKMEMLLWDFEGVVVGRASSTSKSAGVGVVENLIKKI